MSTATPVAFRPHGPANDRGEVTYDVLRDGELLGTVEKVAVASWRKSGRIRTSFIGYSRFWRARVPAGHCVIRHYDGMLELGFSKRGRPTRVEAVALLLAWHDEPARRVPAA